VPDVVMITSPLIFVNPGAPALICASV
jgi:hypothetical protein